MATRIQLRRDTAANWTSNDPILYQGEFGFETDTDKLKVGDGSTVWSGLSYLGVSGANIALDNLAAVAINESLVSDTDSTDSLGSTVKKWLKGFFDSLSLGEIAAAPGDVAGDGQIWVKDDAPNTLWFTDDDGTDVQLGIGGSGMSNANISPVGTDQTAVVNTRYFADLSGLNAIRNFILPAGAVGDVIVLSITVGDADYEYVIKGDGGITINGGAAATEWSRLFITGESVTLVADTNSNWQVEVDDRIPVICHIYDSGAGSTWNNATESTPDFDTAALDIGGAADLANDRINIRRPGVYSYNARALSANDIAASGAIAVIFFVRNAAAAALLQSRTSQTPIGGRIALTDSGLVTVALADLHITPYYQQSTGENTTFHQGIGTVMFIVAEVL